jgi:hypothetical protein
MRHLTVPGVETEHLLDPRIELLVRTLDAVIRDALQAVGASVDGGLVAAAVRIRDEAAEHADALDELLAAGGFDDS